MNRERVVLPLPPEGAIEVGPDARALVLSNLKSDINEFLWAHLPGRVTLDRAERIACAIHDVIFKEWDNE
ncbi:MAG TPA: hypothetical protein VD931_17660 [Baekduia sp.]|nr:hypothetical protein [Baekduia sp.]